ncbi:MAG TPA: hypothetical protein VJM31_00730 [Vicinamibacterales bacterium]|nr:hypothetical protein [Vicinamibacterales bacterium]
MLVRMGPLTSGFATEIDLFEREMEGGVYVEQPPEIHEHYVEKRLGGLMEIEEYIDVHELRTRR